MEGRALLLYDGVCALCNGAVQFLMKRDRLDRFRYAPLQSDLGREVLARFDIQEFPDAVMLLTRGEEVLFLPPHNARIETFNLNTFLTGLSGDPMLSPGEVQRVENLGGWSQIQLSIPVLRDF